MAPELNVPRWRLDWGVAQRPLAGEPVCGDAALVEETAQGCLLAVADGLGHGPEAAAAAAAALAWLRQHAQPALVPLLRGCHDVLRPTRGAVLSLAWVSYDAGTLTWAGVGNVGGVLLRGAARDAGGREHLLCRPGIVGVELPSAYATITAVAPGDTLVLYTDGLWQECATEFSDARSAPQRAAEALLAAYGRERDDALALVARWGGGEVA